MIVLLGDFPRDAFACHDVFYPYYFSPFFKSKHHGNTRPTIGWYLASRQRSGAERPRLLRSRDRSHSPIMNRRPRHRNPSRMPSRRQPGVPLSTKTTKNALNHNSLSHHITPNRSICGVMPTRNIRKFVVSPKKR